MGYQDICMANHDIRMDNHDTCMDVPCIDIHNNNVCMDVQVNVHIHKNVFPLDYLVHINILYTSTSVYPYIIWNVYIDPCLGF